MSEPTKEAIEEASALAEKYRIEYRDWDDAHDARLARLLADVRKKARDDALEGAALIADRAANVMPSAQQRAGAARVAVAIRVSALKDKPDGEQP